MIKAWFLMMSTIFVAVLFTQASLAAIESKTFKSEKIKEVEVYHLSGDLIIESTTASESKLTVASDKDKGKEKSLGACSYYADVDKNGLTIKEVPSNQKVECSLNLTLQIPQDISLRVKSGSGNIVIKKINGPIDLETGSGNSSLTDLAGPITAESGSGNLHLINLGGNAMIRSGSGDIQVSYARESKRGNVNVDSGSGDVKIDLPSDALVKAQLKTGSGEISNDFNTTNRPTFQVKVKTGSGTIALKRMEIKE